MMWKKVLFGFSVNEMTWSNQYSGHIHTQPHFPHTNTDGIGKEASRTAERHSTFIQREPGKSRRQEKRQATTQNAVYMLYKCLWCRLFEKHSLIYNCDSEKTLFINIVLWYITKQAIATFSLSHYFFVFLYIVY